MRKNLITVPSCAEHNNDKSNDDAFLISILVMNHGANEIGQNQFKAKVSKSFEIDTTLPKQFRVNLTEVVVEDDKGPFKTYAMTGDVDRFNDVLDKIGRALYFHYYKYERKWLGKIKVVNEFMHATGGEKADEENKFTEFLKQGTPRFFEKVPEYGANKEVFTFKVLVVGGMDVVFMRLRFYGNANVLLMFHNRQTN